MPMRILLFYPNLYGMNTLPPAIGLFTSILRNSGHEVALFDTTIYENLSSVDADKQKSDNLNARPFDDTLLKQHVRTTNAGDDFREIIRQFSPHLIAMSCTEDMYPLGVELLKMLGPSRPTRGCGRRFPHLRSRSWQYGFPAER